MLRDRIPVMLFLSLQRMNYPLRQQTASRNENGKGGRRTKMARGAEKMKKKRALCYTAHNNAGDARVVLSNDSQAGAQWAAVYRAFIIPPSKYRHLPHMLNVQIFGFYQQIL